MLFIEATECSGRVQKNHDNLEMQRIGLFTPRMSHV